jgi:hypothetical protein
MIRKLKAVDGTLAAAYSDRIEVLQEALEKTIQVTQDAICQHEEVRKQKQEEDDRKLAAEAVIQKEWEELLQKVKDLAASDPQLLAEVGITACIKFSIPKSILIYIIAHNLPSCCKWPMRLLCSKRHNLCRTCRTCL